jgi:hypothetical protein
MSEARTITIVEAFRRLHVVLNETRQTFDALGANYERAMKMRNDQLLDRLRAISGNQRMLDALNAEHEKILARIDEIRDTISRLSRRDDLMPNTAMAQDRMIHDVANDTVYRLVNRRDGTVSVYSAQLEKL